ncbi:MAG: hypothetical protein CL782_00300 [Chloroflexi bacterium]|nr:hypothetical protein [Chloroflexota bacterium]|tara:strand:- start:732 stop:1832 length:1101 start_codon:yes stop_codon:yes gene_type:complete
MVVNDKYLNFIRLESESDTILDDDRILFHKLQETRQSLLSNSLRVTETTVPLVYTQIEICAKILNLNLKNIDAYIYSKQDYNAFSISNSKDEILIGISSSLVKTLNLIELRFLLGHELGHAIFNHSESTHLSQNNFDYDSSKKIRDMEISADRIGYICTNSLEESVRAMMKIASGLEDEYLNLDIRPFIDQTNYLGSQMQSSQNTQSTHPPLPLRARALVLLSTVNLFDMSGNLVKPNTEINTHINSINDQIRKDTLEFIDKREEEIFNIEKDFLKLIIFTYALVQDGDLTKKDQKFLFEECGDDAKKITYILKNRSKESVNNILINKMQDSFYKMSVHSKKKTERLLTNWCAQLEIPLKDITNIL